MFSVLYIPLLVLMVMGSVLLIPIPMALVLAVGISILGTVVAGVATVLGVIAATVYNAVCTVTEFLDSLFGGSRQELSPA